jgi:hypothetical protein
VPIIAHWGGLPFLRAKNDILSTAGTTLLRLYIHVPTMIFRRSKVSDYKDKPGGLVTMLRFDSTALRIVIFVAMSAIFFLFLKVTERKIPDTLAPDSAADTVHVTSHTR